MEGERKMGVETALIAAAVVSAGATAYSEFGKRNFLKKGDELFIYVYNARVYSHQNIINNIDSNTKLPECSKLYQLIV